MNTEAGQQRKGTLGKTDPLAGGHHDRGNSVERQRRRDRDIFKISYVSVSTSGVESDVAGSRVAMQ